MVQKHLINKPLQIAWLAVDIGLSGRAKALGLMPIKARGGSILHPPKKGFVGCKGATKTKKKKMTITKATLAAQIYNDVGLNKREASDLVELFFEEIKETLAEGEAIKLSGFGNFGLRDKNSRPGRNPKTGVEALIKARRVVTFKAGAKLKDSIENLTDG